MCLPFSCGYLASIENHPGFYSGPTARPTPAVLSHKHRFSAEVRCPLKLLRSLDVGIYAYCANNNANTVQACCQAWGRLRIGPRTLLLLRSCFDTLCDGSEARMPIEKAAEMVREVEQNLQSSAAGAADQAPPRVKEGFVLTENATWRR